MTTTEHAELIERLQEFHDGAMECDGLTDDGYQDMIALLRSAITALRTSRRDGWLGAAKEVGDIGGRADDPIVASALTNVADHLRRNAPQEATDEA